MSRTVVYVGTSEKPIPPFPDGNNNPGEGVASFELNDNGTFTPIGVVPAQSPSVTCISADTLTLYAANETRNFFEGLPGSGGGVTSFVVAGDGTLAASGSCLSYGAAPAYLDVSPSGRWLIVANHGSHSQVACSFVPDGKGGWRLERKYDDSSLAVFELEKDGLVGPIRDLRVFEGGGYWDDGRGQSTSHLHCVRFGPDGLVYACNRGADCIEVLALDETTGCLSDVARVAVRPGTAPRYLAFHPNLAVTYACNENYPSVSVLAGLGADMCLAQVVGSMPPTYLTEYPYDHPTGGTAPHDGSHRMHLSEVSPSDIRVGVDGRHVYVSNRSCFNMDVPGSVAVFEVESDGTLYLTQVRQIDDHNPRGIAMTPDGHFLLVAGMERGTVLAYWLDPATGHVGELAGKEAVSAAASVTVVTLRG